MTTNRSSRALGSVAPVSDRRIERFTGSKPVSHAACRVVGALAVADLMLLVGAGVLGLLVRGEHIFAQHFILGLFGLLLTVFIHAVVFTYFAGSGKMINQAIALGQLDPEPFSQATALKSRVTRTIGIATLVTVTVGAFGAITTRAPSWHLWHAASGFAAICVNGWAFFVEYDCIARNAQLVEVVFASYNAKRAETAEDDGAGKR